jgi:hypothetical protein
MRRVGRAGSTAAPGPVPAALRAWLAIGLALLLLGACDNSPHPAGAARENTLFTAFSDRSPRYLDPTSSYSNNETPFTYQTYEPLYGYHYLKRPYQLVPKTATEVVHRATWTRRAGPCPTTRPASRSPRASTTSRSARASCSRRTRPSHATPRAPTGTTR